MNSKVTLSVSFAVLVFVVGLNGIPLDYARRQEITSVFGNYSSDKLIKFMQTFGYLEDPKTNSEGLMAEFLYAEEAVVNGIKNIQKYGGLRTTGVLDEQTISLLSAPRCGVKDVLNDKERKKRYIIGSKNWQKRQITYFLANWSQKTEESKMGSWLEKAFHAWAQYSRLKFKRVYDSSADIIIAFGSYYHGDRHPFDGPGNILAHAYYPYEENAFGGDIHFDNDENWKENATTMNEGVDFLTVLVHELGHSLGLAHSFVYSSLMFPYYKGATPAQLDYDDILAMYQLYITRTLEENADDEEHSGSTKTELPDDGLESSTISLREEQEAGTHDGNHENNEQQSVPDLCEGHFDAVSYLKGSVYVFKESFIWKFNSRFELDEEYPMRINKVFPNLPKRFKKIDAVYQIPDDDEIVFFSGNEYITYDSRGPIYTAYNLTRYTYDPDIEKIDAAMIWSKNNKTYLFSSDRFWKYSENRQMDPFYPRIMARWNGVPENLDGAVSIPNVTTIFFRGNEYWVYDDKKVEPKKGFPKTIDSLFDYCSE